MNNKKGNSSTYIVVGKWTYYIVVVIVVAITLLFFIGKGVTYVNSKTTVSEDLKEDLLYARIVNVCFAYQEDGRVYQNILEAEKITKTRLDNCLGGRVATVAISSASTPPAFQEYNIITGTGTSKSTILGYTIVKDGDQLYPAKITVTV